jgi:hypothetical protein
MLTYCFTTNDGLTVDRTFQMGHTPDSITLPNGKEAKRDIAAEHSGQRSGRAGWPIECYASGVHPDQAPELREHFEKHGCPTEVTRNGDPIYRDHQHRKRALACRGLHDNASFGN